MDTSVLYITSFNKELYQVSGRKLLNTYYQTKSDYHANFFIAYEDGCNYLEDTYKLNLYDLSTDAFLKQWLETNKDIIPDYLGGLAAVCKCRNPFGKRDADHEIKCHFTWWNRNCSRWFRKLVALKKAFELFPDKKIFVWLDCDVLFKSTVSEKILLSFFGAGKHSAFYCKGPKRAVSEAGIVGYNLNLKGKELFDKFLQLYSTGVFREYRRWDDSAIFDKARLASPQITTYDCSKTARGTRVVEDGILSRFFKHEKGKHGEQLGIMK